MDVAHQDAGHVRDGVVGAGMPSERQAEGTGIGRGSSVTVALSARPGQRLASLLATLLERSTDHGPGSIPVTDAKFSRGR